MLAFSAEIIKLAAKSIHMQKADEHHKSMDKDWKSFEDNMNTKGFNNAISKHPESDAKLKRYVKNVGGYIFSKDIVGVAPSRTSNKKYEIKQLASGRWGCGCGDWRYKHSVNGTDCDHISALKAIYKMKAKNK